MKDYRFEYKQGVSSVMTTFGRIRGYFCNGIHVFKGIPYGKAGRFHDPERPDHWEEEKDCTNFGYVCPLLEKEKPAVELCVPHRYWMMDEDCLNLNLWTPALDDKKRPVMVWLHGGGYESGSAIEHIAYDGDRMAGCGDVVVISVNHRLNVLGFMDLSAFGEEYENSGNAGMMDIILALKWIRDNVKSFGGDPENVTLFGQSGGGGKITTLMQMPEADGLYHKGIIMSGICSLLLPDQTKSGEEFVRAMMDDLKISSVKELEAVPYESLAKSYVKLRPVFESEGKNTGCRPFCNSHYCGDALRVPMRKETSQIPLMIGSVFGEFPAFNPAVADKNMFSNEESREYVREYLNKQGESETDIEKLLTLFERVYPERSFIDLLQYDYIFRKPLISYARRRSLMNDRTYTYLFEQDTLLDDGRVPWHCADIPYVFHNTEMIPYTWTDNRQKLEDAIFNAVMAFAKTGNPNHSGLPCWKAVTPEEEPLMFFGENMRTAISPDHELVLLAEKIFDKNFSKMMEEGNIAH